MLRTLSGPVAGFFRPMSSHSLTLVLWRDRHLLELGADPFTAMDGAIYLADATKDFKWITSLLDALRVTFQPVTCVFRLVM